MYDYGKKENLEKYGTETPPQYNNSEIANTKIAYFTGSSDDLADPTDFEILNS